jgi:hypothetical protein
MAKFRNSSDSDVVVAHLDQDLFVAKDATFDVADELVLDEGHVHTEDCTHPEDARVYPSSIFTRAGGSTKATPDVALSAPSA